ncbi:MAG: hypothetical protein ACREJO_08165 [Phycisphaerales bacterium]
MNTQTNTPFTDALAASHLAALQELQTQLTDPAATHAERRLAAAAILRIRPPTPPREAPSPKPDNERAALRRDLADVLDVTSRLMATQPAQPSIQRPQTQPPAPMPGRSASPTPNAPRPTALASAAGAPPATPSPLPGRAWAPTDPLPKTWPTPALSP